jgi:hypothetical protein
MNAPHRPPRWVLFDYSGPVSGLVSGSIIGPELTPSREIRPQWCCASSSHLPLRGQRRNCASKQFARTDFPFHRAAKSGDGTLSKRGYVSDGEVRCQLICLADLRFVNLRSTKVVTSTSP